MAISAPVIGFRAALKEALRTRTGLAGFSMIAVLLGVVVAVPFIAPYDVVRAWGSRDPWLDNPRFAAPEWSEVFVGKKLPRTVIMENCFTPETVPISNATGPEKCPSGGWTRVTVRVILFGDITFVTLTRKFSFTADEFPSELRLVVWAQFGQNASQITATWTRPDNSSLRLLQVSPNQRAPAENVYPLSIPGSGIHEIVRDWAIVQYNATDVSNVRPEVTLFAQAGPDMLDARKATVLKGEYTMKLEMVAFGGNSGIDARMWVYGTVFGIAGTDTNRRDLLVGLLWGAPVALSFAMVASVIIVLLQVIIGAIATWYGGMYDEFVQRLADLLLIIPLLPVLILISIAYSPGIWTILIVLVGLGFVGATTKVARSIVLQVKEEAYIESAVSYGASRGRILFKHIMPRLLPYTFALIALSVPTFIFLEASLSFLGLGDPILPTWGSMLGEAYLGNAPFRGFWWWIAFPAAGIIFATIAFSLLGYSFDKVLNPRLREE